MRRPIETFFKAFFAALFLAGLPLAAPAQEAQSPRTILVLDASGSMWGQIDGKAKITIAQEVIRDLLQRLPEDQEIGLTVYGHRRKGDCADIETLIPPAAGNRDRIAAAVQTIRPKGKTPLSAAVIKAAEDLKYTEEAATVILISDGRETCELDPCEVGRKLEEAGIGFTAHVIGFDVAKPQDRAELQCLAEATGGTFRTASSAEELAAALEVVAEPEPVSVEFAAVEKGSGRPIEDQLIWTLKHEGSTLIDTEPQENGFTRDLLPGKGRVEVMRPAGEAAAQAEFTVGDQAMKVTLELPPLPPDITIEAPDKVGAGEVFPVRWQIRGGYVMGDDDRIAIAKPGAKAGEFVLYVYNSTMQGDALDVKAPVTPGSYELRYVTYDRNGHRVLASRKLEVEPVSARLDFESPAPAGTGLEVRWEGPGSEKDIIAIAKPGAKVNEMVTFTFLLYSDGNDLVLKTPVTPGTYELRYVQNGNEKKILAAEPLVVEPVSASLDFRNPAPAGGKLEVQWEGPGDKDDFIAIAKPGAKANEKVAFAFLLYSDGNALTLDIPTAPGTYELRYVQNGKEKKSILAAEKLDVIPMTATLTAPDRAAPGSRIRVTWEGPGHRRDEIVIAKPGSDSVDSYAGVGEGSEVSLYAPTAKGDYEIRYVYGPLGKVLAKRPLKVE